ncbi:MAG: hypothetical protein EAZ07_09300 [Cytophagales bacterium]|nr:MAG: hypothetical protein EAZ07_09300 [Cytophagales bacterium]
MLLFFGGQSLLWSQQVTKRVASKPSIAKPVVKKTPTKTNIIVAIRPYSDSMAIRFYPTTFEMWIKSKKLGFNIFRSLVKDGKEVAEGIKINDEPILPINYDLFIEKYSKDTNAQKAVALIAPIENKNADANMASAIERNQNQEFLFALALLAANTYPIAAKLGGFTFTDKNVTQGNTYSYRIALADQSVTSFPNSATAGQPYEVPKILGFVGKVHRVLARLQWINQKNDITFAYYQLYRSTQPDGVFKKVNTNPILPLRNEFTPQGRYEFMDTLPKVDIPYYYKLQAFTPFGEASDFSEVLMLRSGQSLYNAPNITALMAVENKTVVLEWKQDDARTMKNTTGYVVVRTTDPTSGRYTLLTPLPIMKNMFEDTKPLRTAFYRVLAVGIAGDTAYSLHKAVSLLDTTAPPRPILVYAKADTNKIVTLRWKPSKADDFMGYRILRANALDEEYRRLNVGVQADTFLIDTISKNLGYRSVYYKVYAIDYHDNSAVIKTPIEVKFPDNTPPLSPQIIKLAEGIDSVTIGWIPSLSNDVVKCQLLRKERYEPDWKILLTWAHDSLKTFKIFCDSNVRAGNIYQYWLKVTDEVGLISSQASAVEASPRRNFLAAPIQDFKGIASPTNNFIKLSWNYAQKDLVSFILYRKIAGGKPVLIGTLADNEREYYDKQLVAGTLYQYYLQANLKNFVKSPITPPLEVQY